MYRKKASIGLFTQYNSFIPFSYKIGPIKCLIHRAFKISSSYIIFYNEINKIENILQKNTYLVFVIDSQIKGFYELQYTTISNEKLLITIKKYILNHCILELFQTQPKLALNKFVKSIVKTLIL